MFAGAGSCSAMQLNIKPMVSFPNAKINLGLNITEKRADGYHNLETIFYPVKLKDAIEIIAADRLAFRSFGITIPGSQEDNICLKAYALLSEDFELPPLQISLLKQIPIGAGLGGGSADGAFLIKLINEQFGLHLSIADMENYTRKLGADCAFFISNKPTYAFNKGDEFEPCDADLSAYYKVLVKPPVHVSTAVAYANIQVRKPEHNLRDVIRQPVTDWKLLMTNDFEMSVFKEYPEIRKVKEDLYAAGATFALMSGSGSAVFALFTEAVRLPGLETHHQVFYNI